jgi:ABC-type branched-subunit amino acid transport system permease subunit
MADKKDSPERPSIAQIIAVSASAVLCIPIAKAAREAAVPRFGESDAFWVGLLVAGVAGGMLAALAGYPFRDRSKGYWSGKKLKEDELDGESQREEN